MAAFDHEVQVSPQEAAEYLVDIAYGLIAGGDLELRADADRVRVRVPVGDRLVVTRKSRRTGDRVELAIELRWAT
jgi:amphi-Trp domain-containing protein